MWLKMRKRMGAAVFSQVDVSFLLEMTNRAHPFLLADTGLFLILRLG